MSRALQTLRAVLQLAAAALLLWAARGLPMDGPDGLLFLAVFAVAFALIWTALPARKTRL